MTSTPVGMRCPECSRQSTQVRRMGSTSSEPTLTYLLIGVNVLVFLGGLLGGGSASATSASDALINDGGLSGAAIDDGEYWRLLTSGFLHAGFMHLFFNMFSLYILGGLLEPAIGRLRFGLIYFTSLLCGSLGALLLDPDSLTVGASGAIFGLMGAAAVVMWGRGMSLMESGLGIWIGLNLLLTFTISSISVGGHVGGLIGGTAAAALLFGVRGQLRLPEAAATALCVALAAAAVIGSIVVSANPA
jgi:membrane associated rhomboid family serine protease